MLPHKKNNQDNRQHRVKPADRKFADMVSKRGKASNRKGTVYGARTPGAASEHFEPGRSRKVHTHGSRKQVKGEDKPRRTHTRETRIV